MVDGAVALEAGRAAVQGRDWAVAYERFTDAGDGLVMPEDLDAYAEAAWWLARFDEALSGYERAYRQHVADRQPRRAAMSALMLAITSRLVGQAATSAGWIARAHRALTAAPENVEHGYLCFLEIAAAMDRGDLDQALGLAGRMQALGGRHHDSTLATLGVLFEGRALAKVGKVDAGMALLDEAMLAATTEELRPFWTGVIYCMLLDACHELVDLRRAAAWSEAAGRWCSELPSATLYPGICQVHRAELLAVRGDWQLAEAEAARAAEQMRDIDVFAAAGGLYAVGELRRLRGDLAGAEDAYRATRDCGRDPQPGHALLRLAQGQTVAALASIQAAVSSERASRLARARLLDALVEIALEAGDTKTAAEAADELEDTATEYASPGLRAGAHRARGAVLLAEGRPTEALAVLRASAKAWQELGAPYEVARARVLLAAAYSAVGDDDAGELERDAARGVFARLGARPDLERIDPPNLDSLPGGLSEREVQVLRLVSAGKSNRAIATELQLSEKTVARHVSNIFVKLGVTSRAAATAYAFEQGLVGRNTQRRADPVG
jgi:DNA-binding NarL/FixJ family response regulator